MCALWSFLFGPGKRRKSAQPAKSIVKWFRPCLEILEDRRVPSWVAAGGPQFNDPAATTLLQGKGGQFGTPGQDMSGRITDMAIIADYDGQGMGHQPMVLGTASSAVWWSSDFASANPTWVPRSEGVPVAREFTCLLTGLVFQCVWNSGSVIHCAEELPL